MSPALRAEPVGAREKIHLEDRLQHQFQRCLDHPVAHGGDPQAATFRRARLRNHPFPYRQRAEGTVLQLGPQPVEEHLDPHLGLHVVDALPVHSGRACTLVTPHPSPGHQQEARVGGEVEQIIEPAVSIIPGPPVQLGLDLQYPALREQQSVFRHVSIHRRSPGLPLPTLLTCWPPWPCDRLSRLPRRVVTPATTTGPPPCPTSTADNAPARSRAGCTRRGQRRTVPTFTTRPFDGGRRPPLLLRHRHDYAVGLHRGLLPKGICSGSEFPTGSRRPVRTATQPISARFELVGRLRSFNRWFLPYAFPSRLPDPHRLAVPARPGVVGAAFRPSRRLPGQAAPSFTRLPRQPSGAGLSPPLGHAAPRGAPPRPPTGRCSPQRIDPGRRTYAARPASRWSAG